MSVHILIGNERNLPFRVFGRRKEKNVEISLGAMQRMNHELHLIVVKTPFERTEMLKSILKF